MAHKGPYDPWSGCQGNWCNLKSQGFFGSISYIKLICLYNQLTCIKHILEIQSDTKASFTEQLGQVYVGKYVLSILGNWPFWVRNFLFGDGLKKYFIHQKLS